MLTLPPAVRVYLARGATDIRKSFDGLAALAQSTLQIDPLSGHLFVFCNRRRDRLKVLYWDTSGYCILHKRLEKGTFAWPGVEAGAGPGTEQQIDGRALALILSGVELREGRRRKWFQQ